VSVLVPVVLFTVVLFTVVLFTVVLFTDITLYFKKCYSASIKF